MMISPSYRVENVVGEGENACEVKYYNLNSGVLGLNCNGSPNFYLGVSLGKILQSPSLVLVKPRKDLNNVSCRMII